MWERDEEAYGLDMGRTMKERLVSKTARMWMGGGQIRAVKRREKRGKCRSPSTLTTLAIPQTLYELFGEGCFLAVIPSEGGDWALEKTISFPSEAYEIKP